MTGLLIGFFCAYLSFSLGHVILRSIRLDLSAFDRVFYGAVLGLGFLSYLVLGVSMLGWLSSATLWGICGALTLIAALNFQQDRSAFKLFAAGFEAPKSWFGWCVLSLGGLCSVSLLASLLAPELANDSLCYHLNIPKIYLEQKSNKPIPFDYNSEFPFFMEMLFTLGLGLGSVATAKFFHAVCGILTAGMIAHTTFRFTNSREAAAGTGLLFFSAPVVFNQLSTTYVDVALACFCFFSWLALIRSCENNEQSSRWLILAGVFAGFALSIKYLALVLILIQGAFILIVSLRKNDHKFLKRSLLFLTPIILLAGYWYLRAYLLTGNPVFPFFYSIFKSGNPYIHYDDVGVAKNLFSFLTIFWTMTMKPGLFEGFGVQLGPGFLAFLPFVLLHLRDKNTRIFSFFAALFLVAWFILGQSLRFLVPALPAFAVLAGIGFFNLRNSRFFSLIRALFIFMLFLNAGFAFYHARRDFKVAAGLESEEAYLLSRTRSYSMAQFVNKHLPLDSVILAADETHLFYYKRKIVRESTYVDMGQHYWKNSKTPGDVVKEIQKRGFTHILHVRRLLNPRVHPMSIPALLEYRKNDLASVLNHLYTYKFNDEEGPLTEYTLYQIK